MTSDSRGTRAGPKRARWIAAGFLAAFALSVLTVIVTGLGFEGVPGAFDTGFKSVTLAMAETRPVELVFDSPVESTTATLEITLPDSARVVGAAASTEFSRAVNVSYGKNTYRLELVGYAPGSGYLRARLVAAEPIGLERVFITVVAVEGSPGP